MPSDAAVLEPDLLTAGPVARLEAVVRAVSVDTPEGGDADPRTAGALLRMRLEGILFVADRPVALAELAQALEAPRDAVERALAEIDAACRDRGVRLQRNGGHVQMVSAPEAAEAIQRFLGLEASARLSRAALESLSIIAYRQPLTRPEIDALRGVNSDGVLRTLLARGLVEPVGRRETVGHPVEYGTTFQFLEYFGLGSLADLPPLGMLVEADADGEMVGEAHGNELGGAIGDHGDVDVCDGAVSGGSGDVGHAGDAGDEGDEGEGAAITLDAWTGAVIAESGNGSATAGISAAGMGNGHADGHANGQVARRRNGRAQDA